ncbi:MAG: TonB family protein [Xanthobacteraceae bacterium]
MRPARGSIADVTPPWVRPWAIGVVALVHAVVIFAVPWPNPQDLVVPVTLQIDVVASGEPAQAEQVVDEKPSEAQAGEVKPVETRQAEPDDVAPREATEAKPVEEPPPPQTRVAEDAALPPEAKQIVPAEQVPADPRQHDTVAMTAPVIKSVELHPDVPPAAEPPPQHVAPDARETRHKEEEAEKRKEEAEKRKRAAAASRVASRAGAVTGRGETGAASGAVATADYRALVNAELNRRMRYPESARAEGATGTVVVSFTIGSSGRVTASSIVRSSGHGMLDTAARQMLSALSLPPPPGGRYSAVAPVHFSLNR